MGTFHILCIEDVPGFHLPIVHLKNVKVTKAKVV